MAIIELTSDNFVETVSRRGITLVDCWAEWCGGCKTFTPVFEQVAEKYPQHTFGSLDTQAEETISAKLEIKHIPTLLLYRDGLLLFHQPGNFGERELEDIVKQAEALNMDEVRSAIDQERKEEATD
jgi:thioredoxin 1